MDLDLVFLGTSGSMPTAFRGAPSILVRRGGERLLVDCGEGTQRQLLVSAIGLVDLREVFFTHYHADHYLGLPGMLKTFALRGREEPITLYGPPGLTSLFSDLHRIFGRLSYEYALVELTPGDRLSRDGYSLEVFPVLHGRFAIGYTLLEDERPGRFDVATADAMGVPAGPERGALQRGEPVTLGNGLTITPDQVLGPARRGRKVSITGDTAPCPEVIGAVENADVLVHEATFLEDEQQRARETLHSTALDAAAAAREADVGLLALTHLSSRYLGRDAAREARTIFPATVVPKDFDTIEVGFEERGGPRLIKGGALHRRERQPGPVEEAVPVEEGAT